MRAEDLSIHCLQLEICWASFRSLWAWNHWNGELSADWLLRRMENGKTAALYVATWRLMLTFAQKVKTRTFCISWCFLIYISIRAGRKWYKFKNINLFLAKFTLPWSRLVLTFLSLELWTCKALCKHTVYKHLLTAKFCHVNNETKAFPIFFFSKCDIHNTKFYWLETNPISISYVDITVWLLYYV